MDLITTYNVTMSDRRIREYVTSYENGEITFPVWQRYDGGDWKKDDYKPVFIISLLEGKDIPKIYTCVDPADNFKEYILDGGHRTRAIVEFIQGKFSIPLNTPGGGKNWYVFTKQEGMDECRPVKEKGRGSATGQTILLPEVLKIRLLRTQLQVVSYADIDEPTSRKIFNELNHQRPMTIPELVNVHSSLLVDRLRALADEDSPVDGLVDDLVKYVPKFKKQNHEFYKFMVAMFSITEGRDDEVFKYCEPSSLIKYVRGDGTQDYKGKPTHNTQFTEEEMDETLFPNFIHSLQVFVNILKSIQPTKINETGDVYSIFQYVHKHRECDGNVLSERLKVFIDSVVTYKVQEKHIDKTMTQSSSTLETIGIKKKELDALRVATGFNIVEWSATTQNNPCGPANMRTRWRILANHFQ
tara:strand:- start:321 stop:1559 length:1239 start_codon:yes stop_codon:yes gene_type:complete